jgi:hypothetical protein
MWGFSLFLFPSSTSFILLVILPLSVTICRPTKDTTLSYRRGGDIVELIRIHRLTILLETSYSSSTVLAIPSDQR